MPKAMSTRESGLTTKPMDRVSTPISTAQDTRVTGTRISSMAMVLSNGQTMRNMKVSTSKV